MATREERLRFLLEVAGEQDLESLASAIDLVGQQGQETEAGTAGLVQRLDELVAAARNADALKSIGDSLAQTRRELDQANEAAYSYKAAIQATEKPSRELQKAFRDALKDIEALSAAEREQVAELNRLSAELKGAGVDTDRLADEQARLRNEITQSSAGIRERAAGIRSAAAAEDQLAARLRESDEAFRRQAAANRTSREALERHEAQSRQAAAAQDRLAASSERNVGLFSRLRGALVGLTAYFGIREAVQGAKNILGLGAAAETARAQLAGLYGSQEAGNKAFADLKQLARENGQEFTTVLEAAQKLKAFGLDPLDGTLQSLIDQNARLGGSQQELNGIILAVGQAWAKQKLQGEEILQLLERGVPVWDLLAKATGKNVQELQDLSSAGALGRDVIKQLLDEIGRSTEGAAASGLGRLSNLVQQLRDRVDQFFTDVSNSGALEFFKQRIRSLIAEFDALQKSGELAGFAKRFSDGMIAVAKAVEGTVRFLVQHTSALIELGKAYLAFKFAAFITGMAASAKSMLEAGLAASTAAKQAGGLAGALRAIPATVKIAIALYGLEAATSALRSYIKVQNEILDAERRRNDLEIDVIAQRRANELRVRALIEANEAYRNTVVLSTRALQSQTEEELRGYEERLQKARDYFAAVAAERAKLGDTSGEISAIASLKFYEQAIEQVRLRFAALKFNKDQALASGAAEQSARQALVDLGLSAEAAGIKVSEMGRKTVDAFGTVAKSADLSSKQIAQAFSNALEKVDTSGAVRELEAALKQAFEQGRVSAEDFDAAAAAARIRLLEIKQGADEAAGGFRGVKAASDEATSSIINGWKVAREALAAESQRIAKQLADAFKSGAEEGSAEVQKLIKSAAAVDEQIKGLTSRIDAASKSQADLASSSQQAATGLNSTQDAAAAAAASIDRVGDSAKSSSIELGVMSDTVNELFRALNESVASGSSQTNYLNTLNGILERVTQQRDLVDQRLDQINQEIALTDENAQALRRLADTYPYVEEARLQALLDGEKRLQREKERIAREQEQADRESERARAETSRSTDGSGRADASHSSGPVTINVNVDGSMIGTGGERQLAEALARLVLPEIRKLITLGA